MDKQPLRIEISYKTILFALGTLIGLWFLVQIRDIIILLFISLILLSALLRPVEWLNARKIPRVLSILMIYLFIISGLAFVIAIIIPPLISQTSDFISRLPDIVADVNQFIIFNRIPVQDFSQFISSQTQTFLNSIFSISKKVISSIFVIITLLVFTFYLLLEWKKVINLATSPFSGKQEKKLIRIISEVEKGLGYWLRAQLVLSVVIGILTFIGLTILKVPYALPLSLIAAILEIIPIVGPIISAIPAVLVSLTISPVLALATAALFFIVQQFENHLIVPQVMSRVVGLQPPIVIVALLIGAKLAGVGGAFLAVPIIVLVKIVFRELIRDEEKFESEISNQ